MAITRRKFVALSATLPFALSLDGWASQSIPVRARDVFGP
jgi:hypothetical protein